MRTSGPELSCRQVARLMHAYLDGDREIDQLGRRRIEAHLKDCLECGLEFEVYAAIKAALARRRTPQDPRALARLTDFVRQLDRDAAPSPRDEASRDDCG